MAQINRDAYLDETVKALSRLDARDYPNAAMYFNAVDALVFEYLKRQWQKPDDRQEAIKNSLIHVLVSPMVSNDKQALEYGVEITCKDSDFSALCAHYKLDEKQMHLLSDGGRGGLEQVNGWKRSRCMAPGINGSPWYPKHEELTDEQKAARKKELKQDQQREKEALYKSPVTPAPITFNPDEPTPLPETKPVKERGVKIPVFGSGFFKAFDASKGKDS